MAKGSYTNIHQHHIDGCIKGDRNSQFEVYKLYYQAMYNTCLRLVEDTTEAEDIMQESFFKAFDKIGTYRNEVSFGAWLKRIVVNTSLDFLKKKKLKLMPLEKAYEFREEDDTNASFEPESVEQLKLAIGKLPEGYKVIINLILIEGYSHDEVGTMLRITASTSRSQLTRAKQRLIELLTSEQKK